VTPTPADDKQAKPASNSGKALPKTGDEGGVIAAGMSLVGAVLTLVGAALRRQQQ
jgi:LPXTG-motif cell wall-anchored protein